MTLASTRASAEWRRFTDGSAEQRMLLALGERFGVALRPSPLRLAGGVRVEAEGMDSDGRIVVQLVANGGAYKPTYRNKVMADMFKLLWLRASLPQVTRIVLVVTPLTVRALGGWVAVAASDLGVEVLVFDGETVEPLNAKNVDVDES